MSWPFIGLDLVILELASFLGLHPFFGLDLAALGYLLLAVWFLLMNYSTALHPIKNFSKALLGLINEEPGCIENLGFFCSIRQTPLPQNGPCYLAASL